MWNEQGKKPIGRYIVLTVLFAWFSEALLIIGERTGILSGSAGLIGTFAVIIFGAGLAPTYSIYILLKKYGKIRGFKDFCSRIFKTPNVRKTVIITAIYFAVQVVPNIICNEYLHNSWYLFILFMPLMILGGGLEEIGWNGFLQPALEEKLPFSAATAVSGVLWAVWHIPLWFVQNANQSSMNFVSFLCHCIVLAFVLATLYKLTKSVFACVLLHAWTNVLGGMFTRNTLENPVTVELGLVYAVEIIAAIAVFYMAGEENRKI